MTPGSVARRVLGPRLFPIVGDRYRRFFVDLDRVASYVPPLPAGSRILDVGGGEGQFIDHLLARQPELEVTLIDIAPVVGQSLGAEHRERVTLIPGTPLSEYQPANGAEPDVVIMSDVMHHIPVPQRAAFLGDVRAVVERSASPTLIVKDVQPGSFKARLAYISDRYVSGDRDVSFIPQDVMCALLAASFPGLTCRPTGLLREDGFNYSIVCS